MQLFRLFAERCPDREPQLAAWIVDNRTNDDEPFGMSDLGARSLAEFERRREESRLASEARVEQALQLARQRRADDATVKLVPAVRRGDVAAVRALLDKGTNITAAVGAGPTLLQVARDAGRRKMIEFLTEGDFEPEAN